MTMPGRLLDRFPVVRTQSADEMCAALERVYAKPMVHLSTEMKKVDFAINYCPMTYIGLGNTKYGIGVSLVYPESDIFMQTFPVRGQGRATIDGLARPLDLDHPVTVSPRMHFAVDLSANYETLLLLIKPQILADKLAAIIGQPVNRPLRFHPAHGAPSVAKALRDHFFFLVEMVNTAGAPLPNLLLREYEETIALMFLHANRHNYSQLLYRAVSESARWQVRQVEEYIEANAHRPISVDELARVAGVSALSLYRGFRKANGCSPKEFAKKVRLRHAWEQLRQPDAATTVASVALAWGFIDLARFERDYFQAFGEHPAQTLSREKGGRPGH